MYGGNDRHLSGPIPEVENDGPEEEVPVAQHGADGACHDLFGYEDGDPDADRRDHSLCDHDHSRKKDPYIFGVFYPSFRVDHIWSQLWQRNDPKAEEHFRIEFGGIPGGEGY